MGDARYTVMGFDFLRRFGALHTPPLTGLEGKSVSVLFWFAGSWKGTMKRETDEPNEEYWTHPLGSSKMDPFRWIKQDRIRFCELMTIEPIGEHLMLRVKHFQSGLFG
jgi:Domain of unknown function (DUF6265)